MGDPKEAPPERVTLKARLSDESQFEAARKEREEFLEFAAEFGGPQSGELAEVNAACGLMLDRKYDEVKLAWDAIGTKYPHRRGQADSQIGAAEFFQGHFHKAIELYVTARANGANPESMDFNIWEACEVLVKQGEKAAAQRYLELCPDGAFAEQARNALG